MPRRTVHVNDYERTREGQPEHVRDYTREQEARGEGDTPSLLALGRKARAEGTAAAAEPRPHIRFERRPFEGGTMYQVAGLPAQVDTAQGFDDLVATLEEPVPGGGRYGGPGIVDFAVEGEDKPFSIRHGRVVRIPARGLFDYDPRFSTVREFREWLQREGRSGVVTWRPYPEDERFYEPYHALFWFEGGD